MGPGSSSTTGVTHRPLFKYTQRVFAISIVLDAATRDASNDNDKFLRRGLVVGELEASPGKYREFTEALVTADTIHAEDKAAILTSNTLMDGTNDEIVDAAFEGDVYEAHMIFATPADSTTFDFSVTDFTPHVLNA